MKLVVLFILMSLFQVQAKEGYAQTMSLSKHNVSIIEVFREIKKQTNYNVISTSKLIKETPLVSIEIEDASLKEVLNKLLVPVGLSYIIEDKSIVIKKAILPRGIVTDQKTLPLVQQREVKGRVTDQRGEPLVGVSVRLKDKTTGATTNANGQFSIVMQEGEVLVFSYIGFVPHEERYSGQQNIQVVLRADVQDIDEVVVVGYGTQKKVNLTGAVSVVTGEEITNRPVGQTAAALQGLVPGLTVVQNSGQPGRDGGSIKIRGIGTLGNSDPLVVLDGVESSINNVDPNEIESITVLKDAASAAIYGSRAANGVILITTKRAKDGFDLNYSMYNGFQNTTDMPRIVNAIDHMNMMNEAYTNTGRSALYSQNFIQDYIANGASDRDKYPDTDWQKLTLKNQAYMQSHYLSLNAGNEKVKVLGSFGFLDQDGIIPNTNFKRYNLRVNTDMNISEKFSSSIDLFLRRTDLKEPSAGTGYVFHWMRRIPANQAGVLSNGLYGEGWNGDHPLARAKDGGLTQESGLSAILNMNLTYKPTNWITAEINYSPKVDEPHTATFNNSIQTYRADFSKSYITPAKNSLSEQFTRNWYNNIRATLKVDRTINEDHEINLLLGAQQEDQRTDWISAYREVFLLPDYQEINAGNKENERTGGSASHWALRSLFSRVNYNYKGKYLFEANARYDGSSRFAAGNRYALFPSFSAGWRVSEESFFQSSLISELKLRGSWGKLGNQEIGLYPYAAFINIGSSNYTFDKQIKTGASLNELANPLIEWETTEVTDVGVDLNFGSKFSLVADYFYRKTTGILLQLDIPTMLGLSAPYQNAGVVENRGWEVAVNYRDKIGEFNYSIGANLSDVKNKVLDMKGVQRSARQVNFEGYPIKSFYGYEAMGLFQSQEEVDQHPKQFGTVGPGDIMYKDLNEDGKIDNLDQKIIGSPIPRYTYGANIDLGYKGFDFGLFLQGVAKADGFLFGQGIMPFFEGGTVQEQHKDRWTPENTDASFPRFAFNETNNIQNSTFWMKSASYLRLKNAQIGYTFPQALLKDKIKRLRIYMSGQNLFTIDNFWEGYDVEAPVSNGSWYPQMKVYTIGLDIKF